MLGLTETQLGELAGIGQTAISQIELGRIFMRGRTAASIASALGCTVPELFAPLAEKQTA